MEFAFEDKYLILLLPFALIALNLLINDYYQCKMNRLYRDKQGAIVGWGEWTPNSERFPTPRPCAIIECRRNKDVYHVYYVVNNSQFKSFEVGDTIDIPVEWKIGKVEKVVNGQNKLVIDWY